MLHKIMIALIAIAAIGAVAIPTDVSARGGHGGHGGWSGGRHFSGFRGGFGYRSFAYPYYTTGSCWRWQATPYGPRRVWVCGAYGYSYY